MSQTESLATTEEADNMVPPHTWGIKPSGNAYGAKHNIKTSAGLFATLPDELILLVLELLEPCSILRIGATCKALCAFSRFEELWKTKYLESPLNAPWRGSWFNTVTRWVDDVDIQRCTIRCEGLYSDMLYRPFEHSRTLMTCHLNIPRKNQIPRMAELSADEFQSKWYDKPFVATEAVKDWTVMHEWDWRTFRNKYRATSFTCEAVDWPFAKYVDYMTKNDDESPLYLFDSDFVDKMKLEVGKSPGARVAYWVPECFGVDYFDVLGHQRPDHRWLIVGPKRSGSTFHKDPNGTSAWNAVVRGCKYWIMFPPTSVPPGVFVSKDQGEVTSPISIGDWLRDFHTDARKTADCKEGICWAGEVLHVPAGWWHLVVNLEPAIAITQNFVSQRYLPDVLGFLKYKPDQVSGFDSDITDPYQTFLSRLEEKHPEILEWALSAMEKKHGLKKRKWDDVTKTESEKEAESAPTKRVDQGNAPTRKISNCFGFCFGCGDGSDEDVP